jgi:hypothetical protein
MGKTLLTTFSRIVTRRAELYRLFRGPCSDPAYGKVAWLEWRYPGQIGVRHDEDSNEAEAEPEECSRCKRVWLLFTPASKVLYTQDDLR